MEVEAGENLLEDDDGLDFSVVVAAAVLLAVDEGVGRPVIILLGWNGLGVGQNCPFDPLDGFFVVNLGVYFFIGFFVDDSVTADDVVVLLFLFLLLKEVDGSLLLSEPPLEFPPFFLEYLEKMSFAILADSSSGLGLGRRKEPPRLSLTNLL